jgi:hypothetical protein
MVAAETGCLSTQVAGHRELYTPLGGTARAILGCRRVTIISAPARLIAFRAHTGRKQA